MVFTTGIVDETKFAKELIDLGWAIIGFIGLCFLFNMSIVV